MHVHHVANDYSLSKLFIMIYNDLKNCLINIFNSRLFLHTVSFVLCSAFLAWFAYLHSVLYSRVLNFLCKIAFFRMSIFVIASRETFPLC